MTTSEYERLLAELTPVAEKRLRTKHSLPASDREEVAQDAMVELVRFMERRRVDNPAALLTDILDKRAINKLRALSNRANVETPAGTAQDLAALSGAPMTTIEDNLFAADLDIAIRDLDEPERDAFILTDLRGLSQYEAGELLDVPAKTVVSRSERARTTIRKGLQ